MHPNESQKIHIALMRSICQASFTERKPLVLKGGTALLLGYGLDRFSEDLDFDLTTRLEGHLNILSLCRSATHALSRSNVPVEIVGFSEPKKTATTHRARVLFRTPDLTAPLSLKIEISARDEPDPAHIRSIDGMAIYDLNTIASQKLLAAYEQDNLPYRTAARDLHDLAFIAHNHSDTLTCEIKQMLETFFSDPVYLMERYADAYQEDWILRGRLFTDLGVIEHWSENQRTLREGAGDLFDLPAFGPVKTKTGPGFN